MASRAAVSGEKPGPSKPVEPPHPNRSLLIISSTLLLLWILFLAWIAFVG